MFKKISILLALCFIISASNLSLAQDVDSLLKMSQAQNSLSKTQTSRYPLATQQNDKNLKQNDPYNVKKPEEKPSSLENEFENRAKESNQSYLGISKNIIRPEQSPTKNSLKKRTNFIEGTSDTENENYPSNQYDQSEQFDQSDQKLKPNHLDQQKKDKPSKNIELEPIKQFGYDLFQENHPETIQSGIIPVSNDYILGPGDHLQIRIWGKFDQVIETDVDSQGNIFLPKIGLIPVAGVRFGSLNGLIKKALETVYVNIELSVALTNLRTIKIFILGYVKHPGAYDVSSLSSLFTSLYSAGGPTKKGSLRNIQLKRHGRTYKTIDLYSYLLNGDNSEDPTLKPFDTIFVPAIGDVIKIEGQVKQPAIYEIKPHTSLYEVITQLAGGFGTHSYQKKIHIERISDNEEKMFFDITTNSATDTKRALRKLSVANGDVITIESISDTIKNSLQIEGNVTRKGDFAYKPGMTLSNLLDLCGGLKPGFSSKIQIFRYISDDQRKLILVDINDPKNLNFPLQAKDIINVQSLSEEKGKEKIVVNGAVKNPGEYFLLKDMKISDILSLAQLENFADLRIIEVYRKNKDRKDEVLQFSLETILTNTDSTQNIALQDQDQISIRISSKLVKIKKVTLSGEFKYPGVYLALENEPLSNIIRRAGGYTEKAFLKGARFHRASIAQHESEGNKLILDAEKKRLIYDQNRNDSLNKDNSQIYNASIAFLQDKIDDSNGRLIIDLDPENFVKGKSDIVLEDGDSLFIPETPNSVQIVGGVELPTSVIFQDGSSPAYYIQHAGGLSAYAESHKYLVFKADGSVVSNAKKIERGDTIYVPEKIKIKTNWLQATNLAVQTLFGVIASLKLLKVI